MRFDNNLPRALHGEFCLQQGLASPTIRCSVRPAGAFSLRSVLSRIACLIGCLLLAFASTQISAQSEQDLVDSVRSETDSAIAARPGVTVSRSLVFKMDLDSIEPKMWSAPASPDGAISELLPRDTFVSHLSDQGELPPAPVRGDLTPLLVHFGQVVENSQTAPTLEGGEHYHWKGLLLQSFWFFGIEQTARLLSDPYFRYLTADKPFWHDYIASLHQWNMGRWSDGDDFLVAYIGHPIQGAVTSFIEIQNDPHDRYLRFSNTRAYWLSRFKGMMWATVFSTDEKVGPLGETALGSEGGYTYIPGCHPGTCPPYIPGVTKYTNNTGWVKFITTPVIGTVWVIGEDAIDRYITGPIEDAHPTRLAPKIVRGGLNPCRSAANAMRLKLPWYRDYEHPETMNRNAVHFISERAMLVRSLPRFEIFPHFNAFSLPINTSQCAPCRKLDDGCRCRFFLSHQELAGF